MGLPSMSPLLLLFLLCFRFSCALVNLLITKAEMNRTLGVNGELWYMERGEINAYSISFPYRVEANIGELHFAWHADSTKKIHYEAYVESDPEVVAKLRVPPTGTLPRDLTQFTLEYRCAGHKSGQFEVTLTLNFSWPDNNHTKLRLKQEKLCAAKDARRKIGSNLSDEQKDRLGGDSLEGHEVFYFIIGAAAAFLALIAFLLILYFRGTRKDDRESTASSRRPSRFASSFRSSLHSSRQPFLTSTPNKSTVSSSLRPVAPSTSPLLERTQEVNVKKCLIDLYADRNLFQIIPFVELQGTFGEVRWAIWRQNDTGECGDIDDEEDAGTGDEAVIVKTLKTNATRIQLETFLTECFSLLQVPPNPHLAQPAAAASFGRFDNPETVTDFPLICYRHRGFGNLKKFLTSCRMGGDDKKSKGSSSSSGSAGHTLRTHELVSMGMQLTRAVAHLHKYGVLHKDIATRNCIVSEAQGAKNAAERLCVQLVDSALSRDLFPSDYACLADNDNRPIKWLAPEAITHRVYTSAGDIWSLGVLLWELLSCGAQPFADVHPEEIIDKLESGYRPSQPYNCPDQLYEIIQSCWVLNPRERPNAVQLLAKLVEFHVTLRKYI